MWRLDAGGSCEDSGVRLAIRASAVLWLVAGVSYLACEAAAAAAFPGYSYVRNVISELGNPAIAGAVRVGSPLAALMNTIFVVHGVFFASAALIAIRSQSRWRQGAVFASAALLHALGLAIVAVFHEDQPPGAGGSAVAHTVGAGLSIVGGNLAVLASGPVLRDVAPRAVRLSALLLGAGGIGCLLLLVIGETRHVEIAFGRGLLERGSVYTIIAWELLGGLSVLTGSNRR
jgi:hypothetical membrane protein